MDLMGNSYVLLKVVLEETANGGRLRTSTRMEIERNVAAIEKNDDFMFELSLKKEIP